ncbi:MAG: diacylglycerol kinase family protein [Anaerolineae bacterium]|nr:diacylglycerol kinase family protein [Thermoflexales bacterium]MDW8408447.1 diacylglycerol kinase family protein [Anaerolineae bacterium]
MKSPSLHASFRFAFEGLAYAFRTQRNFRIHCFIALVVCGAGVGFGLTATQWAIVAAVIGLVFQAELVNTAIEAVTDRASPDLHPLAKVAKDCAAAGVFVSALIAVAVGGAVFLPRVIALFQNVWGNVQ